MAIRRNGHRENRLAVPIKGSLKRARVQIQQPQCMVMGREDYAPVVRSYWGGRPEIRFERQAVQTTSRLQTPDAHSLIGRRRDRAPPVRSYRHGVNAIRMTLEGTGDLTSVEVPYP